MPLRVSVRRQPLRLLLLPLIALAAALPGHSQPVDSANEPSSAPAPAPVLPVASPLNTERILLVMPDYGSVRDTSHYVAPLTPKQKWLLVEKETFDPFNIVSAVMAAGFSQKGNQTPKYGEGDAAFGRRVGAALADFGTQGFFSAGVFANLFHQDPRYFRKGPQAKVFSRVVYSVTRLVVARQDSGKAAFNASNFCGMALGIVASNAYYPAASVRGSVMASRVSTGMMGGVIGNLMSEFLPDLQQKFFHRKVKKS